MSSKSISLRRQASLQKLMREVTECRNRSNGMSVMEWCSSYGIKYSTYYHHYLKIKDLFGRPKISLHKLRHSCASMLINKGWDIKKLQYWLGHTDTQTTLNIYAHFNRQRLNTSENDLNEISLVSAELFG